MFTLRPRKQATCPNTPLDVLYALDPDQLPPRGQSLRTPLNLALVLDRSGSMKGEKMELTIEAACQAVSALQPQDFLAVVSFDDCIETVYSGPVQDREGICRLIRAIEARNSTDLHGGWDRGAQELSRNGSSDRLSRVILLTDGDANHGLIDPRAICENVSYWAQRGVQTTTLGFGAGYNEQLLRPMAAQGGGNHGYIEDARRLSAFFEEELSSLLRTRGTQVRVLLKPAEGVRLRWYTEPNLDTRGQVCLADLVDGMPLTGVVRVETSVGGPLLEAELSWYELETRQTISARCQLALPCVDGARWAALPADPEVELHVARSLAELRRRSAMALLGWNQEDAALQWLDWALQLPQLPEDERRVLNDLIATVERGDYSASFKKAAMYGHGHGHGHRISGHYQQEDEGPGLRERRRGKRDLPLGDGAILHARREEGPPKIGRIMGMLRGHFFGERLVRGRGPLGEGAVLTQVTLKHLTERPFDPAELAAAFNRAPLLHPTTSQQKFRRQFEAGNCALLEVGSVSAGCAALRRMCPFAVAHRPTMVLEAVLATVITHRDNLALTASVGYLALLSKLLHLAVPPAPGFYLETFLGAIEGLEHGPLYKSHARAFKDWQGYLKDFLPMAIGRARSEEMSVAQAIQKWGSGPYLLEVLPTLLYTLELHANDPARALSAATTGTMESDTLGMLVGAAVGALHGAQAGWFLHDELEDFLEKLEEKLKRSA